MARHQNFLEWQSNLRKEREKEDAAYDYLDGMARKLEIDDLPFNLLPRTYPQLQWSEWGKTLQDFVAMVTTVKARLGPPKSVTTTRWIASAEKPPDLLARWVIETPSAAFKQVEVVVCTLAPTGCKIDPRIQPIAASSAIYAELHPECKHVLEELEA